MTDQMMFESWAELLRPLFPAGAQFSFRARRRVICVQWPQIERAERPVDALGGATISFSQLAWKSYRGARSARRARADTTLVALVNAALEQYDTENAGYEGGEELLVEIAAVDLFPPPASTLAGHRLAAAG